MKNKMKRKKNILLSLLLAGSLLFTGCSGGDEPEATTDSKTYVTVTDDSGAVVTDENGEPVTSVVGEQPEELELNVGFIYSGAAEGNAASEIFEAARGESERVLNAKTCYIENVLVSQFEQATAALVEQGCNVIVSTDARFANAIYDEALSNKKVQFVSFGGTQALANLACFQGETYKSSYVCGLAAAYNSDSNILGVVADPSVLSVYSVINGFALGAKELTESQTDVRVNWAWGNKDSETMSAIDDLISQGCDVIFTATYSNFAVKYCEMKGIKVIGMAYNMPELAPERYLTGCFNNLNIFLIDVLRSFRYDTDPVEIYRGGIKEGAVRLVEVSEKSKEGTKEITEKLYQICLENKAAVFSGEIKDTNGEIRVAKGKTLSKEDICSINWLDSSVKSENFFTQPNTEPVPSDLTIRRSSPQVAESTTDGE